MSWNSLEAEANDIQPTAPVGWSVLWYPGGDVRNPVAAMVTAVEGPGKIAVIAFAPGGFPVHHKGVHYIHHPLSKRASNAQVSRCGTWDYLPDSGKTPSSHLTLHRESVAKKRATLDQAEADRKKREEAIKEGKKPALATI